MTVDTDRPAWDTADEAEDATETEHPTDHGHHPETGAIVDVTPLSETDAPTTDAANRIVFNFPNDHDIGGLKVDIIGVTPEQIAVAIFYLNRSANQIADMRQMQSQLNARELAAAQAAIAKERGLITDHRGRKGRN